MRHKKVGFERLSCNYSTYHSWATREMWRLYLKKKKKAQKGHFFPPSPFLTKPQSRRRPGARQILPSATSARPVGGIPSTVNHKCNPKQKRPDTGWTICRGKWLTHWNMCSLPFWFAFYPLHTCHRRRVSICLCVWFKVLKDTKKKKSRHTERCKADVYSFTMWVMLQWQI